ncbi:hypothetical protein HHK36_021487 [Tetracentron sinense]|uniref:C3H1-type domain-containing protein n=1 Tax=Tetracentron sinense TaxID=13715 RepID=A0A834YX21_TETSI|nr:hypothetical protein HHK36_021487 [Tetracentron sinense]
MVSNPKSTNMSVPAAPPPFFPPPFATNVDAVGFWPQFPISNKQHEPPFHGEYPPLKKPRNSEEIASNSFSNPPLYPRMPPSNPPINKASSRIFFKTRLCAKFKVGMCPFGDSCNFAHGMDDMRKPPPNWQELVGGREEDRTTLNGDEDQRIINKMKLCKKFYNGEECPYGDRCNFLHEDRGKFREDSGRFRESSAISIGTTGSPGGNISFSDQPDGNGFVNSSFDANRVNLKPVYWKTRPCHRLEMTGHCPFGEKCHFAHGQAELQKLGCQTEVETGIAGTTPPKPHPNTANDASSSITGIGATCKQQVQCKKALLKWKGLEKISRIYADWIDDFPLMQSSLSKVES